MSSRRRILGGLLLCVTVIFLVLYFSIKTLTAPVTRPSTGAAAPGAGRREIPRGPGSQGSDGATPGDLRSHRDENPAGEYAPVDHPDPSTTSPGQEGRVVPVHGTVLGLGGRSGLVVGCEQRIPLDRDGSFFQLLPEGCSLRVIITIDGRRAYGPEGQVLASNTGDLILHLTAPPSDELAPYTDEEMEGLRASQTQIAKVCDIARADDARLYADCMTIKASVESLIQSAEIWRGAPAER